MIRRAGTHRQHFSRGATEDPLTPLPLAVPDGPQFLNHVDEIHRDTLRRELLTEVARELARRQS
jgi:hypothetical protein